MKPVLTESDFESAALELLCDVPAIKAVCEVEAPHGGFLSDGLPVILFERHKFYQFTKGKFYGQAPDICNPERGGYIGNPHEWARFDKAAKLDRHAAMMSASYGKFQIMGFNFEACGFSSVEEFFEAMHESEAAHLNAFVKFIKARGLDDDLRLHNWQTFARVYNGPGYRKNQYDQRIAAAYQKYARQHSRKAGEIEEDKDKFINPAPVAPPADVVSMPSDEPIQASQNGGRAWWVNLLAWVTGLNGAGWAIAKDNLPLLAAILGAVTLITIVWLIRGVILDVQRMRIASDPRRYTVK